MVEPAGEGDIFRRQSVYPDAEGLISWSPQPIEEIKDEATVVVDTNALLVPFGTGKASLDEIAKRYRSLVVQGRLVIPGQVVREFASNRVTKLQELHQQLVRKRQLPVSRVLYPLLEGLDGYADMRSLEDRLQDLVQSYQAAIDRVVEQVRGWYWNDPVSVLYRDLFSEKVVRDPVFDPTKLAADLARRVRDCIPPGYKDARKDDGGVGDLIIWQTILEVGRDRKTPVLFVTGDQKPDWWHQSEGRPLYPRFELVDEYRRHSGGRTLHLLTFSGFLDLFGANPLIVDEVRKEEQEASKRSAGESRTPAAGAPPVIPPEALRRMEETLGGPQVSSAMWRRMEEALRGPQVSSAMWRGMEEALKGPQISPAVWRGMEETLKGPQIPPEVWRGMEEVLKGPRIPPEVWRGMEDALKGPQIPPEVWRGMEEVLKGPQIPPEAWRGMEDALKRPQIPPEVRRGMEEALKGLEIPPVSLRRMEGAATPLQIPPDALRHTAETAERPLQATEMGARREPSQPSEAEGENMPGTDASDPPVPNAPLP